ncbi:hypothetical protein C8Q76DRAFT_571182, partial [Earliella scabrosa]
MNPPDVLPPSFSPLHYAMTRLRAKLIPCNTVDTTAGQHFARPFSVNEVDAVKDHIRKNSLGSARGVDGVDYSHVRSAPSEELCELFQACDGSVPTNYRTIGLESCMLKTMTLLIDRRLREWAESASALPDSQSGFRKHHRPNNNPFVLRVAAERA